MSKTRAVELNPLMWYYGSASMAFGIKNNAFSYLLLPFATQVLGLPGIMAATALGIAMIWDAVSDLLLGHWSDKTSSRLGRRHPFMYVALFLLPLSFWGLFNPFGEMTEGVAFWYVFVYAILIRTSTTLVEVPSVAQLPELESRYEHRSRWLSIRHAFGWMGGNGLHTINFFFWVGHYGLSEYTGYAIYGWVGAALIALTILISSLGTQRFFAKLPRPVRTEGDVRLLNVLKHSMKELVQSLSNKNFGVLFFYGLVTGIAGGLLAALYLYNTTYFFGFSGPQIAMTGMFVIISPLISMVLIPPLGRRFGKRQIAIFAIGCFIVLTPIPYVCFLAGFWPAMGSWTSLFLYSGFIVVDVVCLIVNGVMLDSMMADVVEDSEVDTNRRSEGLFYATRGFAGKAMSAGGIFLAGFIVSMVGMEAYETAADMTREARISLVFKFLPLYCGLHIIGILLLAFYKIKKETHEENLSLLSERRNPSSDTLTPTLSSS